MKFMKGKINIAELLKDCPQGMELDCTICNNAVTLEGVDKEGHYPIRVVSKSGFHHILTCEGYVYAEDDAKCVIFPKGKTTWEGFHRPFKDGDIIYVCDEYSDATLTYVAILKHIEKGGKIICHCFYNYEEDYFNTNDFLYDGYNTRFATEEEKAKLFQSIKDNGYRWNEETKTLEKLIEPYFKVWDKIRHKNDKTKIQTINYIYHDRYGLCDNHILYFKEQDEWELVPNKFDISNLKPFDKVLARHGKDNNWTATFFSHIDEKLYCYNYKFVTTNGSYPYVIPYEENKHLLGTTEDCDDYYKTN